MVYSAKIIVTKSGRTQWYWDWADDSTMENIKEIAREMIEEDGVTKFEAYLMDDKGTSMVVTKDETKIWERGVC